MRKERFFYPHSNTQKTPCQYAKWHKLLKTREHITGFVAYSEKLRFAFFTCGEGGFEAGEGFILVPVNGAPFHVISFCQRFRAGVGAGNIKGGEQVSLILRKSAHSRLGLFYFLYRLVRAGNKAVFCIDHIYYRFFAPSRIQPAVYHIHFVFIIFLRRLVCGVFLQ